MTLDGSGQQVALDGGGSVGVLSVATGVTFTLNDLTVQNGSSASAGAGLENLGGTVTITGSTFQFNGADEGGAVGNEPGGTLTISDSTFERNHSSAANGGALHNRGGTVNITGSLFALNFAGLGSGGSGGAIVNADGTMNITGSSFEGNNATSGGAIYNANSVGSAVVNITNSSFFENKAGAGAALDVESGTANITFSAFDDNTAVGPGNGTLQPVGGTANVVGSILAFNGGGDCAGRAPADQGYNMESGTDCGFTGTGDLQNASPNFGLSGNFTIYLEQGSPGIDTVPLSLCPAADQNGSPRPDPDSPAETTCDMGAVESDYPPAPVVSSSADPSTFGQPVTFTAVVPATDGGGTVAFSTEGNPISGCSAQPLTQGSDGTYSATCTFAPDWTGTQPVSATYSGDAAYPGSTTGSLPGGQTVDPATTLSSSADPSLYGQPVTFTATVTPITRDTGTVAFYADGSATAISGCGTQSLTLVSHFTYTATCTTSALAVGSHAIAASYSGDSVDPASSGSLTGGQTVDPATTKTSLSSSANPSGYGTAVTFTATVAPADGGGTVAFYADGSATAISGCSAQSLAPASGSGYTATCTTSALAAGSHAIAASYSGDSAYPGSSGSLSGGQAVSQAALTVTASGGAMTYGGTPPAITPAYAGFVNDDGPASLDTAPGCSSTATSASPAGTYPSSCAGAADPNYAISYVSGVVTVGQASTALAYTGPQSASAGTGFVPAAALSSPASACQAGQPVSFTLDVNPTTGTSGTYPLESAATDGTGAAAGASVSTSGWQPGVYTVTASYAGTANCGASTATGPLVVTTPGLAAAGAVSYVLPGTGTVNADFIVAKIPHTGIYVGGISLVSDGNWRLTGTLTGYTKSSPAHGTVTGTGTLSWWNPALNNHHGGWQQAGKGVAFTASFSATTKTSPGSFGIQISYTPVPPQPAALPNSGPVSLQSGIIVMA